MTEVSLQAALMDTASKRWVHHSEHLNRCFPTRRAWERSKRPPALRQLETFAHTTLPTRRLPACLFVGHRLPMSWRLPILDLLIIDVIRTSVRWTHFEAVCT